MSRSKVGGGYYTPAAWADRQLASLTRRCGGAFSSSKRRIEAAPAILGNDAPRRRIRLPRFARQ